MCMNRLVARWRAMQLQGLSRYTILLCTAFFWILGRPSISGSANRLPKSSTRENASAPTVGGRRPVNIEDAIEMTRLADPYYVGGGSSNGRVAQISPDKTKFVTVLRKGHIDSNTNEYSLLLWRTQELFASATPEIPANSVSLVVTSPPFLDVVDYAGDNWLRCWFLGIDPASVKLTQAKKLDVWQEAMTSVFHELHRVLKPGGHIAFEVGEVRGGVALSGSHL